MIVAFCPESDAADRLRNLLPPEAGLLLVSGWRTFVPALGEAMCAVVWMPALTATDVRSINTARRAHPVVPVVVVTRLEPASMRLLGRLDATEIVWTEEVERCLRPAIDSLLLRRATASFARALHLLDIDPHLLQAMIGALHGRPPSTIASWAGRQARSHSSLLRLWRRSMDGSLGLGDYLDMAQIVAALELSQDLATWGDTATELGISRRSLSRKVRKHLGVGLRGLSPSATHRVVAVLVDAIDAAIRRR